MGQAVGCLLSGGFEHSDRFAGHQAVENVRAKIDIVGPHDRPSFRVYPDLPEKAHVFKRPEYAAAADNAVFEIELTSNAVAESQLQAIPLDVPDLFNSRKHSLPR